MTALAVVGGGWAGIAAAVLAADAGAQVTLFELAQRLGGRARAVDHADVPLDNGQHILIGAYVQTLALMRRVGVQPADVLCRLPLQLRLPDGTGLALPAGAAVPAFVRGVLGAGGWRWRDRLALLAAAGAWAARGFACDPSWSVDRLCRGLPRRVRDELIDPLCVAALNTPAPAASAAVLLRILRDALFSGPGAADLLLPTRPLDELLPTAAARWLVKAGVALRLGERVVSLQRAGAGWSVGGRRFDAVVLACTAAEAARLAAPLAPSWASRAAALRYEPIVTVYASSPGTRLPSPMTVLRDGPDAPAQFVFDHGALGARAGRFAFVVSGAAPWVARGLDATADAVLRQAVKAFPAGTWAEPPRLMRTLAEKRATFRCTPGLARPPARVAPGLAAAGDYVDGPYPATLEGAVRSGAAAAAMLLGG